MEYAPECKGCRAMYGARNPPGEPPCDTCRVVVLPGNEESLKIYMITRQQYIMGFGGPIDINHIPVWEMIDRLKVKDPMAVFERVTHCARVIISEQMRKKDE